MRRSVSAPLVAAPQRIRAGARRAGMAAGRSGPASSRTVTLDSRTATGVRLDAPVRIAGGQAGMKGSKRRRRRLALGFGLAQLIAALVLAGPSAVSAGTTVNLDQWATLDHAWQNGNLNGNNSRYPEGGIVPFRLALEGLSPGAHEIRLEYDFTAGGHKAYDFLATWNATNAGGAICLPSGGAISSMCPGMPAPSTYAFPSDFFVTDGLSVLSAQVYAGIPRRLTLWGGTITAISAPMHSGSASGNSSVEIRVSFKTTGSAVLLAWGGHLAQSSFWDTQAGGARDGASLVSGAPWHVRTLGLDGSGAKNQDRSIQPSAIVGELPPGGPGVPTFPAILPPLPKLIPPNTSIEPPDGVASPSSISLVVLATLMGLSLALVLTRPMRRRR